MLIRLILCFFLFLLLWFELGKFWFLKFMLGCWSFFLYVYAYVYVGFSWCNIDMFMLGCWSFCICHGKGMLSFSFLLLPMNGNYSVLLMGTFI